MAKWWHWSGPGADQEQKKFSEEFEQHIRTIARFIEVIERHIPYLHRKADIIDEYLQQR